MSKRYLVLTAVGPDRPGLVKEVSKLIHRAGCNLEDSRMAVLAGEFALILLLSGPATAVAQVEQRCEAELSASLGLRITVKATEPAAEQGEHLLRQLTVQGADQPGIVHRVGEVLADQQINVASLESRLGHAAFTGTPLFILQAQIQIPKASTLPALQTALEQVCEELDLTYTLEQ